MFYVLTSECYGYHGINWDGYYTGDTYIFQGEKYAICDRDISKAKKYTSRKRAENAAESLLSSVVNYVFKVKKMVGEDK